MPLRPSTETEAVQSKEGRRNTREGEASKRGGQSGHKPPKIDNLKLKNAEWDLTYNFNPFLTWEMGAKNEVIRIFQTSLITTLPTISSVFDIVTVNTSEKRFRTILNPYHKQANKQNSIIFCSFLFL